MIVESSTQFGRNLLEGIARYGRLHHWRIHYEQGGLNRPEPSWLKDWTGDGVICRAREIPISRRIAKRGLPVVACVNGAEHPCPEDIPDSDHAEIGRMAADYFLAKGFRHFAVFGFSDACFSHAREAAFQAALLQAGRDSAHVSLTTELGLDSQNAGEADFLQSLPLPCAVFCVTDERAAQILNLARACNRSVPEQLSILGVDNDPLLCQLSNPALSSIDTNSVEIGVAMAARLEFLMNGRPPGPAPRIAPLGVIERVSTSWDAVADPHLVRALAFIRNRSTTQVTVEEVARAAGVSRRSLEYRFRDHFQTSVAAFLRQRTVDSIKSLLLHTNHPLERIAEILGIEHLQRLHSLFRRETGVSPATYRRSHGRDLR